MTFYDITLSLTPPLDNLKITFNLAHLKRKRLDKLLKNQLKIVLYHLILIFKGYDSLYFKGKEVIVFFKTLNRYFKNYNINDNEEKKERIIEYIAKRFKRQIKRLLEYNDLSS